MEKTNDGQSSPEVSEKENKCAEVTEKKSVRWLPAETWAQVIAWIARMELAQRFSFACRRFSEIAHVRLHERSSLFPPGDNTRWMRSLLIDECEMVGQSGAKGRQFEAVVEVAMERYYNRIEWPNCPMPDNIVGMEQIDIDFFDAKVFAFFDRIRPLLAKELHLGIWSMSKANLLAMQHILPLCTGPVLSACLQITAIVEFSSNFPQHWAKCQLVNVSAWYPKDFRNGMLKLIEWLAECRDDGQPKLLRINEFLFDNTFTDLIKQHFLASTQQASFVVRLPVHNAVEFCEINGRTNEQLSLTKIEDYEEFEDCVVLITRCPIGADQQVGMVKAREKLYNYCTEDSHKGLLNFCVYEIGSLDGINK